MKNGGTLVSRAIVAFRELQGCDNKLALDDVRRSSFRAADLLTRIYEIGLGGVQCSRDDQEVIASLIEPALFAIGNWISFTTQRFPPHNNLAASKRERSGLKYLLDGFLFANFEGFDRIRELLEDFKSVEDVEGWDELLMDEDWRFDFDLSDLDLLDWEKDRIPTEHRWCFSACEREQMQSLGASKHVTIKNGIDASEHKDPQKHTDSSEVLLSKLDKLPSKLIEMFSEPTMISVFQDYESLKSDNFEKLLDSLKSRNPRRMAPLNSSKPRFNRSMAKQPQLISNIRIGKYRKDLICRRTPRSNRCKN